MPEPSLFRHYQIVQDADGNNVELVRNSEQVAVLAFDIQRLEYVHCHVLLEPLQNRAGFEESCKTLQQRGHPALARMIEFGEDEGNPFYITSNVDGEPLRAYLARLQDIPGWLAIMIAGRALETVVALCERGEFLSESPLESLRIVQAAPQAVQVLAADFRVLDSSAAKKRALKTSFEKQAKFLRTFLVEQGGTLPDHTLAAADFAELLSACLSSAGCFNSCVKCQNIGLKGDFIDGFDDFGNIIARTFNDIHCPGHFLNIGRPCVRRLTCLTG